jgi:hypothetical protein
MIEQDWLSERFAEHRDRLHVVACGRRSVVLQQKPRTLPSGPVTVATRRPPPTSRTGPSRSHPRR